MSKKIIPIEIKSETPKKKSNNFGFLKRCLKSIKNFFKKIIDKFKKLKKQWKIGLLVLLIIIIVVAVFFVVRIFANPSPDKQLQKIAEQYYVEKIEPADKKSTSYTLVLKNLQKLGYDISPFESVGCSSDSYVVIYLNTAENTYTTDTKLVGCE